MERKDFLRWAAFSGIGLAIPFLPGCKPGLTNLSIAEPPFLLHIMDKKALTDAGKDYVRQYPDEKDLAKLEGLLTTNSPVSQASTREEVYAYYEKMAVDDFGQKRTVVADGWVLSRTEARQSALFEMINE